MMPAFAAIMAWRLVQRAAQHPVRDSQMVDWPDRLGLPYFKSQDGICTGYDVGPAGYQSDRSRESTAAGLRLAHGCRGFRPVCHQRRHGRFRAVSAAAVPNADSGPVCPALPAPDDGRPVLRGHRIGALPVTLPSYSQTLVKVLSSNARVYAEHNGDLYYSNGQDCGRIAADNVAPWALPTPRGRSGRGSRGRRSAGGRGTGSQSPYSNSVTGKEGGAKGPCSSR